MNLQHTPFNHIDWIFFYRSDKHVKTIQFYDRGFLNSSYSEHFWCYALLVKINSTVVKSYKRQWSTEYAENDWQAETCLLVNL